MSQSKKTNLLIVILVGMVTFLSVYTATKLFASKTNASNDSSGTQFVNSENLPKYKVRDLKEFNGNDDSKPVYIGLDGYVYDVSAGREYYKKGGSYHYLAGKDSSTELHFVGADIIKKKYPVVGVLVN